MRNELGSKVGSRLGFVLLVFFACKSGASGGAQGQDAGPQGDDLADAATADTGGDGAANAAPLDCSQDDADWPFYNHDVCNTRAPTTTGGLSTTTAAKLAVKWKYAAAGEISATPAVVGGQLYVGDWGGMMTRIDTGTGQAVWSKSVADLAGLTADGGAAPDTVVARATPLVTPSGLVFGLSRTGFNSSASLAYLVAVNPDTGALLWKTLLDDHRAAALTGAPVLEG
ncbi:MAG: PQQ-binding-like beta-propeller repeat protein, partial [Polyangiaceae bacterium]